MSDHNANDPEQPTVESSIAERIQVGLGAAGIAAILAETTAPPVVVPIFLALIAGLLSNLRFELRDKSIIISFRDGFSKKN